MRQSPIESSNDSLLAMLLNIALLHLLDLFKSGVHSDFLRFSLKAGPDRGRQKWFAPMFPISIEIDSSATGINNRSFC